MRYHSRLNPECNTERDFIDSLYTALGGTDANCSVGIGQMKAEFWPEILIWKAILFPFLIATFDNNV